MEHRSFAPDIVVPNDDYACGNKRDGELAPDVAPEELRQEKQVGGPVNCSDSELCTFLLALGAGFLPTYYSDTSQSVRLKLTSIASRSYQYGKKTVVFHGFPSLQMSSNLMEGLGTELWTWFLEDSLAKRSLLRQEEEMLLKKTCGTKCVELRERYALSLYLQKMFPKKPYYKRKTIFYKTDTTPSISNFQRKTLVQTMNGNDFGYLHTPTTIANFAAPSMQKHKSCRNFVTAFGKPSPGNFEYLMGWPSGWTDLKPLEMDKFLLWQQKHLSD